MRKLAIHKGKPIHAAPKGLTRRSAILKGASSFLVTGASLVGGGARLGAEGRPFGDLPTIASDLLFDEGSRQSAAIDWGFHIKRMPLVVLRPRSVDDVVRTIIYANRHGIKVAMRGQGHSAYGQSQVEGGIVIDSTALSDIRLHGNDALDAQPGALWGDVATAALARDLTPPVMVDAMTLSVGGTLSAGGTGETSYRFGAQVDHVLELDVVTGAGEFVTCSPERNEELFRMTLAGMGQCAIIVRARLRLVPSPKFVVVRTLMYDDVDAFISDQIRLTTIHAVGLLNGRIARDQEGRPSFALLAGYVGASDDRSRPAWMADLRFKSEASVSASTYWDYLHRRSASVAAAKLKKTPNPALVATLPQSSVQPFIADVLSASIANIGIWFFEVSPRLASLHAQPLQKMPAEEMNFELRMQRRADAAGSPDHNAMLAANRSLIPRIYAAGGKVYPPFAPILTRDQWHEHYGRETWQRFAAAKKRFDPNSVLTPGAGIF